MRLNLVEVCFLHCVQVVQAGLPGNDLKIAAVLEVIEVHKVKILNCIDGAKFQLGMIFALHGKSC